MKLTGRVSAISGPACNSVLINATVNQLEQDDRSRVLNRLNLKVANLRADAEKIVILAERTPSNIEQVLKLLRRSEALEKSYVDWLQSLPPSWDIKTVAWIDSINEDITESSVHPGRVDSFAELWIAFTYSFICSCRLFIWTTILRCIAWLGEPQDYKLSPEYSVASRVCGQIVEDIVASVPYYFGWRGDKALFMGVGRANFACGTEQGSIKGVSGIFALLPIFTAATSDFATPSQRLFLRGRMQSIYASTGMNQAAVLLHVIHPGLSMICSYY